MGLFVRAGSFNIRYMSTPKSLTTAVAAAASATEVGSALRSYSAQPLTTNRVAHLAYLTAVGIGVSAALKYALSYASMMIGGADEPDEDKKKAFGNKQQQQRATQSRDTLMLYGALLSVPSSYNPSVSFEQSIATEAVKALDGRDFNMDNIAQNMLKSTVGPFGSYRFTSIGDSLKPGTDLFLASIATAVGSNPLTEAAITAMSGRDVFGKSLEDNPHARIGDVKLPSDVTFNGRIADALSGIMGVNVSEKHVGALLSNFPYIKDVSTAVGLNRFVRKDDSEYTASFAWRKAEADLRPLVEKFNANRQRIQRDNGERQTNAQFSSKSLPEAQDFVDAGLTQKEAQKLEIYYEVTNATRAATQDKEGKARMVTKLGRQENDNIYAQGILALRALE